MFFHIIYVSTAVDPMGEQDLVGLLHSCRLNNGKSNLTGMLLYKNGHFMQVLEGEEPDVKSTFGRISIDLRHKSVDVLRAEPISCRNFPNWTMGFRRVDENLSTRVLGHTRFLEFDFRSPFFAENTVEAHAMLMAFRGFPDDRKED